MEEFLRYREQYCVSVCARFLQTPSLHNQVWYLEDTAGIIQAMILCSGGLLFPVFGKPCDIPPPRFLSRSFLNWGQPLIHSVQGLVDSTEPLEAALANLGYPAPEHRDYDLMALNGPLEREHPENLPGLVLRKPGFPDLEAMLPLQAGYEKEEVLPKDAAFTPHGAAST